MNTAIPERLYKYQSASLQSVTSVSNGKIWFSDPTSFNDPFDCAYEVVISTLSRADCIALLETASKGKINRSHVAELSDEQLRQQVDTGLKLAVKDGLSRVRGVACFAATVDSLLMWGHYAQGHQGFCLEFDTSKDEMFSKAKPVAYADTFPSFDAEIFTNFEFSRILELLLTKAKCWEYEQEWRILHKDSNKLYGYNRASLVGIHFGAKMPEAQRLMIAALLQATDTKLYQMQLDRPFFKLRSEPLSFTQLDYRTAKPTNAPNAT